MNNKLTLNTQPNCVVHKFQRLGFMCSETNAVYVLDEHGYQLYMPLDEALQYSEVADIFDLGEVA